MSVPPEKPERWDFLALLFGAATTCAAFAAVGLGVARSPGAAVLAPALAPALVLVAKIAVDRLARWGRAPLLPVATAASAMLAAGLLCWMAWSLETAQIRALEETLWGGETLGESPVILLAGPCALLPLCAFGVRAVARGLRSSQRTVLERGIRGAAVGAAAALWLLTALGTARALTLRGIDLHLRDMRTSGIRVSLDDVQRPPFRPTVVQVPPKDYRSTAGDVTIVHACDGSGWCRLGVASGADAPPSVDELDEHAPRVRDDALLVVAHHEPDLVLVHASWRNDSYASPSTEMIAFRREGDRWRAERSGSEALTRRASPPFPWIVCGLAGVLLSVWPWVAGLRASRRGRALAKARDFVAGTHEEHAEATEREVLRHAAMALAIASLAASPLAAAAMAGLVW